VVAVAGVALGLGAEVISYGSAGLTKATVDAAVGWVLIGGGLWAAARWSCGRVGWMMAAAGFAWFLGNFENSSSAALSSFGTAALYLHRGPLVQLALTYLDGPTRWRAERALIAAAYVCAAVTALGRSSLATLALSLALVAVGATRPAGAVRRARAPTLLLALALAAPTLIRLVTTSSATSNDVTLLVYQAALLVFAVVTLAGLARDAAAHAGVADLVVELGDARPSMSLRDALARALGDRSLEVAYWLPETRRYVDERGRTISLPASDSPRAVTPVEHEGKRVAALVHDPSVLDDPRLVEAVSSAARLAVANGRLQAEVQAQLEELRGSRRRIFDAADTSRRGLEQRLHDGAERRLHSLAALVRATRTGPEAADANRVVRELLEEADDELRRAIADVGELARGIHPRVLSDLGLRAALTDLAERAPVAAQLEIADERFPEAVEAAAYFVCSEALTNVAKYAGASRVTLGVARRDGQLVVVIDDDGVGGADPARGSGLSGLADRVAALGGALAVASPVGGGTVVSAEIPLTAAR
jgi:signal transduction histidine kinase